MMLCVGYYSWLLDSAENEGGSLLVTTVGYSIGEGLLKLRGGAAI